MGDRMKEVQGTELYWHKLGGVPRVYANILPPLNSVLSERGLFFGPTSSISPYIYIYIYI